MPKVTINFKLHDDQRRIWEGRKARNTVRCGRKYGKSTLARYVTMKHVEQRHRIAYIAPEYQYLTDWWEELADRYHSVITRNDVSNKRVEFVNNSKLDLWSMDNLNAIRPHEYDVVIADECALSRYFQEAWEQAIRPTLTKRRGIAWFMSTPKQGLGGPYFKTLCKREGDRWASFHAPSAANPHLSESEIEEARLELPDAVFRQEYLAEFVELDGVLVRASMIKQGHPPSHIKWHIGVDLAISTKTHADYTAIAVVGRDKDTGITYVRDMWRGQVGMHDAMNQVVNMAKAYDAERIYVEEVGYQAAFKQELLRTTSLTVEGITPQKMKTITKGVHKMDNDKVRRFMPLLSRYEQGMVIHHPSLPSMFADELLSFPPDSTGHDDMVDALVYGWASATKPTLSGVVFV